MRMHGKVRIITCTTTWEYSPHSHAQSIKSLGPWRWGGGGVHGGGGVGVGSEGDVIAKGFEAQHIDCRHAGNGTRQRRIAIDTVLLLILLIEHAHRLLLSNYQKKSISQLYFSYD